MTKTKESTERFYFKQRNVYGNDYFEVYDRGQKITAKDPTVIKLNLPAPPHSRKAARLFVAELNRDPKVVPGARVRLAGGVANFGASEPDELHRVTADRYSAGDEGVLAFPHPNQEPDGCAGWWYVAVDSKTGPARKLYVGVWPGGFVLL